MSRLVALYLSGALLVIGCHHGHPSERARTPSAPPSSGSTAAADTTPAETDAVAQARQERDQAEAALGLAEARLRSAEAARDAARIDRLRLIALWVAGIALLGSFAGIALGVVMPVGLKRWGLSGAAACAAVFGAAVGAYSALAYLPVLIPWLLAGVAVVALGGVVVAIWYLSRFKLSARAAADHADRLEAAVRTAFSGTNEDLVDEMLDAVKKTSARKQVAAGVGKTLAAIRGKPAPQPAAES